MRTLNLIAAFVFVLTPAIADQIVNNGGFSSGFAGWTVANQAGSDGSFLLQSGVASPVNGVAVPAPPGPLNAAMTDAQGPGTHVLYQDFVIPALVGSAILSFDAFIGNRASAFFVPSPASLDFAAAAFDQQARVDILLGSASPFSVNSSDVLLNVFQTTPGSPLVDGYTGHSVDIASVLNVHLNTPLRLRFAETDNVSFFQFGVDNVSLVTASTASVPEPSAAVSTGLGALMLLAWLARRSNHRADLRRGR
jgi:hypothetical protein